MSIFFERIYKDLQVRRQKIIDGKINCIPCQFKRFSEEWPGIEQRKFYGVTGQQKAGKTQLADALFLYHPFFYAFNNPDKIRFKLKYFSLEISADEKYKQFLCHLLFVVSKGRIRVSQRDLNSTEREYPISKEILDLLNTDEYRKYYEFFEENVEIISHIRNPTGIHAYMKKFANDRGTWAYKEIDWQEDDGSISKRKVKDFYTPNDPDEYVIFIIDHISLISTESDNGRAMSLHESMSKLSSRYLIDLRDSYGHIPVIVQQQALSGESTENVKLGRLKPSVSELGDNKLTSRDVNIFFGIFSPIRNDLQQYMGYDITKFKDNIRFMEIMVSREGGNNNTAPLYFDGAVNFFKELPRPNERQAIEQVYAMLENIRRPKPQATMINVINKNINYLKNGKNSRNFWAKWGRKINRYCNKS